jgi:four helix bundle protein
MKGPIYEKSKEFSLEVLKLYKVLQNQKELVISKQLLASATSVGANIREASAANSRKDFINKMVIASKEAREAHYWLDLVKEGDLVNYNLDPLISLNGEIIKILNSIILSSQGKPKPKSQI